MMPLMAAGMAPALSSGLRLGPWLWGARADSVAFVGSTCLALLIALAGHRLGVTGVSDWMWLVLILGVDVAHVHATWFRTYFDRSELERHPLRYLGLPLLLYAVGVLAYHGSPLLFWRVLVYMAVFHFVRQQAGWVNLYRSRAGNAGSLDRWIDQAAIYSATLYPLLEWHVRPAERAFAWFMAGDFVALPLGAFAPAASVVWGLSLLVFFAKELVRAVWQRELALGKILVVASTAVSWYVGIVAMNSDFVFTATNVLPHGVPYAFLLFHYVRQRSRQGPSGLVSHVAAGGVGAFAAALLMLAFVEELLWDRLVDHDRAWMFGSGTELEPALLGWLVPLLALPQATHYVLDGLLWRRSEARVRPAQRAAVGFVDVDTLHAQTPPAVALKLSPEREIAR
ncbi:MAG TPA: hypothetical protein VER33_08325 [Polyangiaceae bacterium]|nr:hypothetical protein [Polyangiaceae bacterium]